MHETITAREGYILTNGEIYGKILHLAEGLNKDDFHEITVDEYNAIQEAEAAENMPFNNDTIIE